MESLMFQNDVLFGINSFRSQIIGISLGFSLEILTKSLITQKRWEVLYELKVHLLPFAIYWLTAISLT